MIEQRTCLNSSGALCAESWLEGDSDDENKQRLTLIFIENGIAQTVHLCSMACLIESLFASNETARSRMFEHVAAEVLARDAFEDFKAMAMANAPVRDTFDGFKEAVKAGVAVEAEARRAEAS